MSGKDLNHKEKEISDTAKLFSPYDLAGLRIPNRIVMSPVTRTRTEDGVPNDLTAAYYCQRASAGLIVTEGSPISQGATPTCFAPGIYTPAQVEGWKKVTKAVHDAGGIIFIHLWHAGRASHVKLQPDGKSPVSSVARTDKDVHAFISPEPHKVKQVPASPPRALTTEEIPHVVQEFVRAAQRAIEAGFDGVELHGAHGHLLNQFINGELNTRTDRYGGSITNRLRFPLETIDAVVSTIGSARVAIRLSPFGHIFGMHPYNDEVQTYLTLAAELSKRQLAYVSISDFFAEIVEHHQEFFVDFRKAYSGTLVIAGGFNKEHAERALSEGKQDLVAFGHDFIANPDLVERLQHNYPLASPNLDILMGPFGSRGLTDYPRYEPVATS